MNFFEHQQRARQNTWRLVALFMLAVAAIIILASALIATIFWGLQAWTIEHNNLQTAAPGPLDYFNAALLLKVTASVTAVIALVIAFKYFSLHAGGRAIAEQLGGRPVSSSSSDFAERQLLNVVEEMAIASGMPVPSVFLLEDTSINAFAAGLHQDDAVIGVTRGAIERLNRDQLQGVIAHEFSHILHGDSRLNVYLIIILAGIVFLATAGRLVLRGSHRVGLQYARSKNGVPILFLGVGLLIIGSIGTLFGNLIKAAVSRQREFLADAAAVQYTRNPAGIGEALKIIGGSGAGTVLMSARAEECSHLFFGDAIGFRALSWMATHPPIEKRIRRIEPRWDGVYLQGKPLQSDDKPKTHQAFNQQIDNLQMALAGTGLLDPAIIAVADQMMDRIPDSLYQSTQELGSAVALMYALRLDPDPNQYRRQLALFNNNMPLQHQVQLLFDKTKHLNEGYELPLVELSIPALKTQSPDQYHSMKKTLAMLISADNTTNYKEWLHYRLLCHYLDQHFSPRTRPYKRSYHAWHQVQTAVQEVLSLLAWFGSKDPQQAQQSLSSAAAILRMTSVELIPAENLTLDRINLALAQLDDLVPLLKENFLSACATGIDCDQTVTYLEWDLLRVVSACLGCPMPLIQHPNS